MNTFAKDMIQEWKSDKLWGSLSICWLLVVAASFFRSYLLPITLPAVGTIFLFRLLLPVVAVLYLAWAIRTKERIWKDASTLEKWVYLLIAVMLIYSVLSLPRAMDFAHTFRKLFNLCFDLCFFFLMLRLCRDEKLFHRTMIVCAVCVAIIGLMGAYEIFNGGIFNDACDARKRFMWFDVVHQAPIVTFENQNDYCTAMTMCTAVLLLFAEKTQILTKKKGAFLTIGCFSLLFLLIKAAGARLNLAALWVLFAGLVVYILVWDRKKIWIPTVILSVFLSLMFINQYRYIVPPIRQYVAEMEELRQQQAVAEPPETTDPEKDTPDAPPVPEKPSLELGDPRTESLDEQFFSTDEETGEKVLRDEGSAGERSRLIIHAVRCFIESRGLGVGLGNTEVLAAERDVVPGWADEELNSIHCFVIRLIADYGIFVLVPLLAIGLLLLKRFLEIFYQGVRSHDRHMTGYALLFLFVLMTYPFTSTAPSDAQDIIAMWFYLATVVLLAKKPFHKEERSELPSQLQLCGTCEVFCPENISILKVIQRRALCGPKLFSSRL